MRGFPGIWKLHLLHDSLPGMGLHTQHFSLSFSLIFCPTSFWREWAAFLDASCPLPAFKVVLWKFLSTKMTFWWICAGESGSASYSSAILGLPHPPWQRGFEYSAQHNIVPSVWGPDTNGRKERIWVCPRHQICGISANRNQFPHTHWASRNQFTSDTKSSEVTLNPQGEGSISENCPQFKS